MHTTYTSFLAERFSPGASFAEQIADDEVEAFKGLHPHAFCGMVDVVLNRMGMRGEHPTQKIIDACKKAVCDHFYGGSEPEFSSDEAFDWWSSLEPDSFVMGGHNSHYLHWAPGKEPAHGMQL